MRNNTSHLLIDENPIMVQPSLAKLLGLNEAIILQQIHYWIRHYRENEKALPVTQRKHFKLGRWWVYNSYTDWKATNFDFWSESTIKRAIKNLVKKEVLVAEQLTKHLSKRQNWYSIDYDKLNKLFADADSGPDASAASLLDDPEDADEEETDDPIDQVKLTRSKHSNWPDRTDQSAPILNRYLNRDYSQKGEEEVNDGSAIGETAPDPLVIDSDLAEAISLFESTGRQLTQDVLARFEQMAARSAEAAQANDETSGAWLTHALSLALGKAKPQSVLNYSDKVIGGWAERGYRIRRRKRSTGEELSPELEIFQQATGRLPLPDQRNIAISLIHQHTFSSDDLRPFWEAWVVRDKRRSDLTWLTDWAVKGEIPQPSRGKRKKTSGGISPAVANYVKKQTPGEH